MEPDSFLNTEFVGSLSLAEHYGIGIPSGDDIKKLKTLWQYASKESDSPKAFLTSLDRQLGGAQPDLEKAYRWVRLRQL